MTTTRGCETCVYGELSHGGNNYCTLSREYGKTECDDYIEKEHICINCAHGGEVVNEVHSILKRHFPKICPKKGYIYCEIYEKYVAQRKNCKFYRH